MKYFKNVRDIFEKIRSAWNLQKYSGQIRKDKVSMEYIRILGTVHHEILQKYSGQIWKYKVSMKYFNNTRDRFEKIRSAWNTSRILGTIHHEILQEYSGQIWKDKVSMKYFKNTKYRFQKTRSPPREYSLTTFPPSSKEFSTIVTFLSGVLIPNGATPRTVTLTHLFTKLTVPAPCSWFSVC